MTTDERLIWKTIGATLRERRRSAGYKQSDLAVKLDVHRATVEHYELGLRAIPKKRHNQLRAVLGMTYDDFNPALQQRVGAVSDFLDGILRGFSDDQLDVVKQAMNSEIYRRVRERERSYRAKADLAAIENARKQNDEKALLARFLPTDFPTPTGDADEVDDDDHIEWEDEEGEDGLGEG